MDAGIQLVVLRAAAPPIASQEADNRRQALGEALSVLNERERRIFEARRLADDPITLEDMAAEFGVSRERVRPRSKSVPSRRCRRR